MEGSPWDLVLQGLLFLGDLLPSAVLEPQMFARKCQGHPMVRVGSHSPDWLIIVVAGQEQLPAVDDVMRVTWNERGMGLTMSMSVDKCHNILGGRCISIAMPYPCLKWFGAQVREMKGVRSATTHLNVASSSDASSLSSSDSTDASLSSPDASESSSS